MSDQKRKRGWGCSVLGIIAVGILLLVLCPAGYLGVRLARRQIKQFTDAQPVLLPASTLSPAAVAAVKQRVDSFRAALREGRAVEPLVLSGDEVNALIATYPGLRAFRDRLFVTLGTNDINAQFSFPAEQLGLDPMRGRYINGQGTMLLVLHNGSVIMTLSSVNEKGEPVPETLGRSIRGFNLADGVSHDPAAAAEAAKIQDVRVNDGKLVITPITGPQKSPR